MGTAKMALMIQMMRMITLVRDLEAWLLRGNMMALYLSTAMAVRVKMLAFTLKFCSVLVTLQSKTNKLSDLEERTERT